MSPFTDQIAVVTGAGSGIGKAIALALAARGAMLCLVGRQAAKLEAVAARARASGVRASTYDVDLAVEDNVRQITARLERDFGAVDIVVHSAGIALVGQVSVAPAADFDLQYRTNVFAPYVLTQTLLPMLRQRRGQIVFINSSVGLSARANVSQYAATKHALKAVADSLRDEINADGIRVLSVYPGRTATPTQAAIHGLEGRPYHPHILLQPEDVAAVVINALGLPRTAEVTDIRIRPLQKWNGASP